MRSTCLCLLVAGSLSAISSTSCRRKETTTLAELPPDASARDDATSPNAASPLVVSRTDYCGASHAAPLLQLSRERCLGSCPEYTITICSDGRVEYVGEGFVLADYAETNLSSAQLSELRSAFLTARYFELGDAGFKPRRSSDDRPIEIWFSDGDRSKSLHHGESTAPDALANAESRIDSIVGVERWIGTNAERDAMMDRSLRGLSIRGDAAPPRKLRHAPCPCAPGDPSCSCVK